MVSETCIRNLSLLYLYAEINVITIALIKLFENKFGKQRSLQYITQNALHTVLLLSSCQSLNKCPLKLVHSSLSFLITVYMYGNSMLKATRKFTELNC